MVKKTVMYHGITYISGLIVYSRQRTNSATHNGISQQAFSMKCEELSTPSTCQQVYCHTLYNTSAVCLQQLLKACIL
jgi:hypothetical protein